MSTLAQAVVAPQVKSTISFPRPDACRTSLETVGANFTRYGLVIVLLWIGALKFTAAEAAGIQGLVANSPLMSWLYRVFSLQGASNLIGTAEICIAVLLAAKFLSPRASFIGSLGAILTFAVTTTFLFSTPGVLCSTGWSSAEQANSLLKTSCFSEARSGLPQTPAMLAECGECPNVAR